MFLSLLRWAILALASLRCYAASEFSMEDNI